MHSLKLLFLVCWVPPPPLPRRCIGHGMARVPILPCTFPDGVFGCHPSPDGRVSSPGTRWCRPAHPPPGHGSFRPCGKRWPWRRRMAHRRRSDGAAWTAACTVTCTRWPCQARGRTETKKTRMEACDVRDAPENRLGPIHSRWMASKNARVRASKGKRT